MTKIFVSHAYSDRTFVDGFVDTILRLGCGLDPSDIFYTSAPDTGVPSGEDLMAYVRRKAEGATLVVAIVSPMYQSRPVCIAELGAAWGLVGKLFPVMVPGMKRSTLEGVLPTMAIRSLDDRSVLDELRDAVQRATSVESTTSTWGRYVEKWLASVDLLARSLETPRVIAPDEHDRVIAELDSARSALKETLAEQEQLKAQMDEIAALKDQDAVAEILLSQSEIDRFEAYLESAKNAMEKLTTPVKWASWSWITKDEGVPLPNRYEDQYGHDEMLAAIEDGELIEDSQGLWRPDPDYPDIEFALEKAGALNEYMKTGDISEELLVWFKSTYRVPFNLRKRATWQKLLCERW